MERRALGRGLASLIPQPVRQEEARPIVSEEVREGWIAPGEIVLNDLQPRKRFDQQKIEGLKQSIREKGILVPLIVSRQDGGIQLISGERRLRAARELGLEKVPVIFKEAGVPERLELALIENIQREDLNPIEEGLAYESLIDRFGYSQEDVAQKVGKDRATIANLLRLLKLPTKVRESVASDEITMGHARALLGISELERQLYFVGRIVEEGWSVRELERRVASKRMIGVRSRVKNLKPIAPHLVDIVDQLRRVLGTQVRLVPVAAKKGAAFGSRGKILIDYYSEDDLDRIYRVVVKNS